MTVLVFDSGVGGLSVLREARTILPEQQFIYVGDVAGFPYGDWEEAALTTHIVSLFDQLLETYRPDAVVIACNTASTLILPALRKRFDVPFIGTVPAIKPAAEQTRSGLFSVLGTPGTVKRAYTHQLVEKFASNANVTLVAATGLAKLAEEYLQKRTLDSVKLLHEIEPCFVEDGNKKTDIVVLACTHYPFLVNAMRKLAPWPVDWLNPAEAVALRVREILGDYRPNENTEPHTVKQFGGTLPDLAVLTSKTPTPFVSWLLRGFGFDTVKSLEANVKKPRLE